MRDDKTGALLFALQNGFGSHETQKCVYNADFESRQGMYLLAEEVLFSAMYSKSKYFP